MDIILDELKIIANEKEFNIVVLEKDYVITYALFLLKDIENIYFKGGTALNKIFLNHERLSEDLDFTINGSIADVERKIKDKLKGTIFEKITHDKRVDNFVRLVLHYKLFHEKDTIFLDINSRAKIYLQPKKYKVKHLYTDIPQFSIRTLDIRELIAEKMTALVLRYAPRDYYDIYNIIEKKLPIDMRLIKKKFKDNDKKYDVERIFKRGYRIYNKWESDLLPLTSTKPDFKEVMETIAEFFKYRR